MDQKEKFSFITIKSLFIIVLFIILKIITTWISVYNIFKR